MYIAAEDARSDIFLAAAVYVIGPLILTLLFRLLQVGRLPGAAVALALLLPLLVTAAMPLYLMRYRGERWSSLFTGTAVDLGHGFVLAAPIVLAGLLTSLAVQQNPLNAVPLLDPLTGAETATWLFVLARRLAFWGGLAVLVAFVLRRAPEAFGLQPVYLGDEARRAAIVATGAAVVFTLLLLFGGANVGLLAPPLGALAAYGLAERGVGHRHGTQRWTVLSPVIVAALGVVAFAFNAEILVGSLRSAAIVATIVLAAVVAVLAGRGPRVVLSLAVTLALLTSLSPQFV